MVYRKQTDKLLDWNIKQYDSKTIDKSKVLGEYETSNVWFIDPCFDKVHSAVFPLELCKRVITFYSFVNDLVFDPFGGSGTLAKAALELERYFLLTEIKGDYVKRIKNRLAKQALLEPKKPGFFSLKEFIKKCKKEL
jgi:DNA modification methylase